MKQTSLAILLSVLVLFFATGLSSCQRSQNQTPYEAIPIPPVLPVAGKYYHGVYPGGITGDEDDITAQDIDSYETTVGKQVAWVFFSHNWFNGRAFPSGLVDMIHGRGSTPYIRLMLRSDTDETTPETVYTLDAILRGDFDADLELWGRKAAQIGYPMIVEWGTEMNGQWFSWNGVHNGGAGVGPQKFVQAYRHIIDIMDRQGASNLIWVFHVNNDDDPAANWNRFENYYPGDGYIDWIGVSVYSLLTPLEDTPTDFRQSLDGVMARLDIMAPSKPVVLAEFGETVNNPNEDAAQWADGALADILSDRWPRLRGFSWWNETWQNDNNPAHDSDLRVQSDANLAQVFQTRLASPKVITRPVQ